MASGSPVCCSRSSSLPEVAGDAARYFDPAETEDIRQVLQTVLADQALRDAMREQGLSRAAGFSWRHTAELTYAVYQSLLGSAD